MTDHDDDLRSAFRTVADRAQPAAGAEERLLSAARRRRAFTVSVTALSLLVLIGGIAGASMLWRTEGIDPAPGREEDLRCSPNGYDIAVYAPGGMTDDEIRELGEELRRHESVASATFYSADEAAAEFRRANPEHEGPMSMSEAVDQYRLTLKPGVDMTRGLSTELAFMGGGSYSPALKCGREGLKFARYFYDGAIEDMSANGVVEVNSEEGSICLEGTYSANITAAHLIDQHPPAESDVELPPAVAVTFFDPVEKPEGSFRAGPGAACIHVDDRDLLHAVIDDYQRFAVDFHRGPNDDPGLVARLQEEPGPQWTELSQPLIRTGGYIFSMLEFKFRASYKAPTAGRIALRGNIGFEGRPPGTQTCSFEVFDWQDELVGSVTSTFLAMEPSLGMIKDTIDVNGIPARVDVECSPGRSTE